MSVPEIYNFVLYYLSKSDADKAATRFLRRWHPIVLRSNWSGVHALHVSGSKRMLKPVIRHIQSEKNRCIVYRSGTFGVPLPREAQQMEATASMIVICPRATGAEARKRFEIRAYLALQVTRVETTEYRQPRSGDQCVQLTFELGGTRKDVDSSLEYMTDIQEIALLSVVYQ
jgi:hypothetical protein